MFLWNICMFANLLSFLFNHENAQPLFFLHLSISGTVNNIKIICSIRFSLLITINRFYKLFFAEGAFVNRRPEMISPLFFIPRPPSNLRPFGAPPSIGRREWLREPLPLEGATERSEAGLASFFGGEAASSLPSPLGKALPGKRYSRFFIRPTQKRPSLTSGRFYMYYLLRETLIKSQNSISHVFSCNASSYSSLNSSLFASEYSLHCMKI